jgi:sugar phosphate permease
MPQRYFIVGITAVAALWLYVDRVCFSTLADPIQRDLGISDTEKGYVLGAFFFTYALFQIPVGALADRFGARAVLAVSIAAWSLVTAATGFAQSFTALLAIRLMLGVTESGAYPAAAGLVKNWARAEERGRFSSVVALGGRIGGALAPWLTTALTAALAGVVLVVGFEHNPSGVNWRGVLVIYGLCGLTVAVLFWLIVRDRPPIQLASGGREPPVEAEQGAHAPRSPNPEIRGLTPPARQEPRTFVQRLGLLARSRNMWLFGALQFGVNLGWAFLVTLFPTYLNEAFGVPLEQRGPMQSMVLTIGCVGMFLGGVATDAVRAKLGPRLGRAVPIGVALAGCAAALLLVPALASVWLVVAALGVMAFLVDLHNPSIWSFAQDVGGRNVGAALGWGNMWGNLGAALSPVLLTAVKNAAGWDVVFVVGGTAFAAAAACGLMLDATRPVDDDPGGE